MNRKTLALVTAAHLFVLIAWHGIARAGEANMRPVAPQVQCSCADCDLDHNGRLALADWQLLFAAFGKTTKQDGYSPRADFNRDGVVNGADWQTATSCCPPPSTGQ